MDKKPVDRLPLERLILPMYIFYILLWIGIVIVAVGKKDESYQQFKREMNSFMVARGYEYNSYSTKENLRYDLKEPGEGDIEFRVRYGMDGYEMEQVTVSVSEYHPEMLEILEYAYPQIDFMAYDELIREAIENKLYVNEKGGVSINPNPENSIIEIDIDAKESGETGYWIYMWLSKSEVEQTVENMQNLSQ